MAGGSNERQQARPGASLEAMIPRGPYLTWKLRALCWLLRRLRQPSMKGQGLNDLPRCELERRSSHHKVIFFELPLTDCKFGPIAKVYPHFGTFLKSREV